MFVDLLGADLESSITYLTYGFPRSQWRDRGWVSQHFRLMEVSSAEFAGPL